MSDSAGMGFFRFLLRLVGVNIRWSITICVALRRFISPQKNDCNRLRIAGSVVPANTFLMAALISDE